MSTRKKYDFTSKIIMRNINMEETTDINAKEYILIAIKAKATNSKVAV